LIFPDITPFPSSRNASCAITLAAGDESAAKDAFRKSAQLSKNKLIVNPSEAEAMYLLAWANAMGGESSTDFERIDRAISNAPNDPYVYYYDALLKTRRGEFSGATEAVRLAIEQGYPIHMLAAEPHLEPLRAEKEFADLLAREKNKNQ